MPDSIHPIYRISFTFNKPDLEQEDDFRSRAEIIQRNLQKTECKFIFQLERGAQGRLHYQGHVNLKVKQRLLTWATSVRPFMPGVHVSPSSKDGEKDAEWYCMKEETREGGPWADKDHLFPDFTNLIRPTDGWQLQMQNILTGPPEERYIYWVWETTGRTGKSNFATWMELNHSCMGLGLSTAPDNFYAVSEFARRAYIFDVPRSLPKRFDWAEVYMSLEKIKDRNFLSTKYKPKKVILPIIPHVVVFSNQAPDLNALSVDRWKVFKIVDNALVPQL